MRVRSAAVAVLVVGLLSARASAQWTTTSPLPDGYNGHALIASGGYLYNTGGSSNNNGILDSRNVFYAPVTGGTIGAWKATTALPEGVYYHAGLAVNGYLYVLGGQHLDASFNVNTSNVVYYAKTNADGTVGAWQTASSLPESVFFLAAAAWNGTIYATGGWNGTNLTAGVYSAKVNADGSLSPWVAQRPLPEALYTHATVSNGTLYVLAGAVNGGTQIQNTVYYSKINADGSLAAWAQTTPLPTALSNHAGIYGNNTVFVMGGWTGSQMTAAVIKTTANSDGTLGAWTAGPSLPDALYLHSAAVSGQYIFVSGGADAALTVPNVYSLPLPPPPPPPSPTDALPPRSALALGTPIYAAAPPFITPSSPLTLSAVDDALTVGDDAGVGVQASQWSVDGGSFTAYSGSFQIHADGAHWVQFYSVDKLGHAEAIRVSSAAVDGTAPVSSVSVGAPQAVLATGEVVVGPATALAAAASDPVVNGVASGVASLSASVDGAAVSATFTLPAADGPHQVVTSARDNVGNVEGPRTTTIYRDGTAPVSSVSPDGSAILGAGAALSFSASDPASGGIASGVNRIEYSLDGGSWTAVSAGLALGEGSHALQYRAVDNVANVEAARSAAYKVDLTAPQTTLAVSSGLTLFGVDALTGDASLSLSAADPVSNGVASGVAKILYSIDGGADQAYSAPFHLGSGAHTLSYGAVDNAGNAETRHVVSLSVSPFLADAAAGLDSVKLSGGASITGSVRSNGSIVLSGNAAIRGDATAPSVTTSGRNATISGTVSHAANTVPVGAYDVGAARAYAQAHNNDAALPAWALSNGVLSLSGGALTLPAGDYYVKGISLAGKAAISVSGRVNLFVDGPIAIAGQATLNAAGDANDLWIVGAGDASLSGEERSAFNLYDPSGAISMSGEGAYAGRQLGKTVALTGKAAQPSTTSVPAPRHEPGEAEHLAAKGCAEPSRGDGEIAGRKSASSSSRQDSAAPEASGFSSASAASFGAVPPAQAVDVPLPPAPSGVKIRNAMPPLSLSKHIAMGVVDDQGSAVHAKDGSGVVLPAGAVANGLAVSVAAAPTRAPAEQRRQDDASSKRGLTPAAPAIQYGPEGTHFNKPVTLEIPYDPSKLPAGAVETALVVHYWNPGTGDWEAMPSSVDTQNHVVRAQTTHFSLYQIFAGAAAAAAPAPGATLAFGQVYAYPNPAKNGVSPVIHVEAGSADHVEIRIYDLSGELKDSTSSDGARTAFEYRWDPSGAGSGVYIYVVTASQNGGGKIRRTGRLAVIK